MTLLRVNPSGEPYRDLDAYDAYVDRLSELDPEDRPAFIRETREHERALRTQQETPDGRSAA